MTWVETTFHNKIHIKHGFAFKGEYFSPIGKYMVLTPGNFNECGGFRVRKGKEKFYTGEIPAGYILHESDLIVAMTEQGEGLLGSTALVPNNDEFLHNQRLGLISVNTNELDKKFLYFLMNTSIVRQQIRNTSSGTKVRHTSPRRIYDVKFTLPAALKTQKKIAAILSTYDDLIENNKRRIALLENMAEEIYREWFVRFRFPGYKTAEFEKGVPKGWEYEKLDELCVIIKRGVSPKYSEQTDRLVINQKCIRNGHIDLTKARLHDSKVSDEKYIQHADALINSTGVGTLGRVSVVEFNPHKITVDSHVTICRADKSKIDPVYLSTTVAKLQSYFEFMASGSTGQVELNRSLILGVKVLVPTKELMAKFSTILVSIFEQKQILYSLSRNLIKTKDQLLPRLISGKLLVEDLNIEFPPSMQNTAATSEG